MAVAASLNVNLTATSGQFTSTMTKAMGTMKTLGTTAKSIGQGIKSFAVIETLKKGVQFVKAAVANMDELAKSSARVGVAVSKTDFSRLERIKASAARISDSFDAMKLQILIGLAPALDFLAAKFSELARLTVANFSVMQTVGKAFGGTIIVIGKIYQGIFALMESTIVGLQANVLRLVDVTIKALKLLGQADKAAELEDFRKGLKMQVDLGVKTQSLAWKDIFKWPDDVTAGAITDMQKIEMAKNKAFEVPQGIKLGSSADAIFGYKQKAGRVNAANNPQAAAANKQVGLLAEIKRDIHEMLRLQGATTVVTA